MISNSHNGGLIHHTQYLRHCIGYFSHLVFATCGCPLSCLCLFLLLLSFTKDLTLHWQVNACNLRAVPLVFNCYIQLCTLPELKLIYFHTSVQVLPQIIGCFCTVKYILSLYFKISGRGWNQARDLFLVLL
jgi:hypothetical protein